MKKIREGLVSPILTAGLVALSLPATAYAAGQAVTIVDSISDEPARVLKGALVIRDEDGGPLKVVGTVEVRDRALGRRSVGGDTDFTVGDTQSSGSAILYQVPEGKRLVVTHVSGYAVGAADGPRSRFIFVVGGGHITYLPVEDSVTNGNGRTEVFSKQVHLEFEAGRNVAVTASRYGSGGRTMYDLAFSGYLLDL